MNIKWVAADKPVGAYKTFAKRDWPTAYFKNEQENIAAMLVCDDDYVSSKVEPKKPIFVKLPFYHSPEDRKTKGAFTWQTFKVPYKTLKEAKDGAIALMAKYPQCFEYMDV